MLKYEYMIVYWVGEGMGRVCLVMDNEISCFDDVKCLDEPLTELNNGVKTLVIDFKLLRTFKED